ncbi:hypothetical protein ACFLXV_00035 [Chloroflexota bacterium]
MKKTVDLRFNPLDVFKSSRTPMGLYARKKWMGEELSQQWQDDYSKTVSSLLEGQLSDGSWNGSFIETVRRLFGLHLTVTELSPPIKRALDWLISKMPAYTTKSQRQIIEPLFAGRLNGLPFTTAPVKRFQIGASLFLASIYSMHNDDKILAAYENLYQEAIAKYGRWCGWSCSNNILRAFVVHPKYSRSDATELAIRSLYEVQSSSGTWPRGVPFYQTVNLLGHLDSELAEQQLMKAFNRLHRTQTRYGTWGKILPEWNTFLVVHALKRKNWL